MQLTERQRELRKQIDIVAFYGIHAVEYFNGVTNVGGDFWAFTQNCYGERAVHLWCQLFNSYNKEPTHYRNLFGGDALASLGPAFSFDNVRNRLIASSELKEEDYLIFRQTVIDFRNKYAAHREFDMGKIKFPELDYALSMFYEMRDIVRESVDAELQCLDDDEDLEYYLQYCETTLKADLQRKCKHELEELKVFE